jgi:hypothetical protein
MTRAKASDELATATARVPNDPEQRAPDDKLAAEPADYSAVGGPDSEPAYGRSRSLAGEYPFNAHGGPSDRDEPSYVGRGGILSRHVIDKRT